jgi:hypothetical protein
MLEFCCVLCSGVQHHHARLVSDAAYLTGPFRALAAINAAVFVCRGASNGCQYKLDLHFLHPVDPSTSIWKVLPRSVQMNINKASVGSRFWPRLLHDKAAERATLSVDWNKFIDETEYEDLAGLAFDLTPLKDGCRFTEVLHEAPTVELDDILDAAFDKAVNTAVTY